MIIVACVLRSGGEYRPEHVVKLQNNVAAHLAAKHRFICLSDLLGEGYEILPLAHHWPGWWSKIELFDGRLKGPILYLDLDTVITGPIDDLVVGHRFTVLENFWTKGTIGSGLMAWDCNLPEIYRIFRADPARYMAECVTRERFGDQGFIAAHSPVRPDHWQARFPGRVVSYRKHCLGGVPQGASIVCFGGKARPWNSRLVQN